MGFPAAVGRRHVTNAVVPYVVVLAAAVVLVAVPGPPRALLVGTALALAAAAVAGVLSSWRAQGGAGGADLGVLEATAEGNLTAAEGADLGRGPVGATLRRLSTRLQTAFIDIRNTSSTLTVTSGALGSAAQEMVEAAHLSDEQSDSVATATQQLAGTMQEVSQATSDVSSSVESVAAALEELNASFGEVAQNCQRASRIASEATSTVNLSTSVMGDLSRTTADIGNVLDVIQDIAARTNLLALNATIEATRAGDAGRGFAVVASEVKELSKQTAGATDQIAGQIEAMRSSTARAVESATAIRETITEVDGISQMIAAAVEEQLAAAREISHGIANVSRDSHSVAANVDSASQGLTRIADAVAGVHQNAARTSSGAAQTRMHARELARLATNLESILGHYRTRPPRFDIGATKLGHNAWRDSLSQLLTGAGKMDLAQLNSHTTCGFGKWYFGAEGQRMSDVPAFAAVGRHHERIHAVGRRLVEAHNEGRRQEAEQLLADLDRIKDELFDALDELYRS